MYSLSYTSCFFFDLNCNLSIFIYTYLFLYNNFTSPRFPRFYRQWGKNFHMQSGLFVSTAQKIFPIVHGKANGSKTDQIII